MVKYKIIEMVDGKVTFTKKELEDLLDEVYNDGYESGRKTAPPIWGPGVKEISNEPTCMNGTVGFNGKAPTMTLKDEITHSSPWSYDEKTKRYNFYPVDEEDI